MKNELSLEKNHRFHRFLTEDTRFRRHKLHRFLRITGGERQELFLTASVGVGNIWSLKGNLQIMKWLCCQ